MRIVLTTFLAFFVALAMISCSDDSGVNIIDVGNGNGGDDNGNGGEEELGTVYSITFNVDGGGTFTFSVDMDGATIEGDDLPDDFDGDVYTFDPDNDKVFIAGGMVGWPQPGTQANLQLTRAGASPGITVDAGPAQFKFFIVPPGVTNDDGDNASWAYGEREGDPNRSVDIESGGDYFTEWGDQPEVEEPETPQTLYMIGSALNMEDSDGDGTPDGWQWDLTDAPMISVHSKEMFWKIVWLNEGGEFKFAPQKEWNGDFGSDGQDPTDELYSFGTSNISVPGETGYYMVVVNFETEEISVTEPLVYLIGNTIGTWDTAAEGALFDVDNENEVVTITRELESDELRMYAWFDKGWFTDWWQSEFMIFDGEIEFRGAGDDQERVSIGEDGEYTIELNFKTGEGSITAN